MLDFRTEFERIFEEHNISYDVKGIITTDKKIYSLGTDSKVLSTVFELLVRPVIYQVAQQNGMIVREAKAQNYYPDFTLMESEADEKKNRGRCQNHLPQSRKAKSQFYTWRLHEFY